MIKHLRLLATAALFSSSVYSQDFAPKQYPQGYFAWPVAATKALAANFGELRPNHYHMGLDCKTDQRENVQVLAAADGYIAKVKIEPSGFGRAIYINHPNGLTTLYAHLNDFYPALEQYITEQQYQLKSWKIFLDIPANLFPVKQGAFIAYSGNTGGSQGPHLHFEIRDTKTDKVLNPLLFGFPITDHIAPDVLRLAVYNRRLSTYEQSPRFIPIKKSAGGYTTTAPVINLNTDKASFAITAYDRYTGSTNQNGIFQAVIFDNNQAVCGFQLDSISYDETRYLNAHIDYKLRSSGGPFVQHLSRLPGYPAMVYKEFSGDGVIDLSDDSVHQIRIEVKDTEGNTSVVTFNVKGKAVPPPMPNNSNRLFKPNAVNIFENDRIRFYMPEKDLYDSIRFQYTEIGSNSANPIFQLHNGTVPVQALFPISIYNNTTRYPNKMVMHRSWGAKNDFARAVPQRNWYTASFRAFGRVQLITDTIAPSIVPVGFKDGINAAKLNRIAFVISDASEELTNFWATLDGQWLRFSNDKGRTFIYKMDQHCGPGLHELIVHVEDCVGNVAEKKYRFTR